VIEYNKRAFVLLQCSASIASRSHILAMSIRVDLTLAFGERAAICRHSTACRLYSPGVIIAAPHTQLHHDHSSFLDFGLLADQEKFPKRRPSLLAE